MARVIANADARHGQSALAFSFAALFSFQSEMQHLVRLAVGFLNRTFLVFSNFRAEEGRPSAEGSSQSAGEAGFGNARVCGNHFPCRGHLAFFTCCFSRLVV